MLYARLVAGHFPRPHNIPSSPPSSSPWPVLEPQAAARQGLASPASGRWARVVKVGDAINTQCPTNTDERPRNLPNSHSFASTSTNGRGDVSLCFRSACCHTLGQRLEKPRHRIVDGADPHERLTIKVLLYCRHSTFSGLTLFPSTQTPLVFTESLLTLSPPPSSCSAPWLRSGYRFQTLVRLA